VKYERQEIEINNTMQAFRKIVKKSRKVAMLRDRFCHFEQGFELAPGMFKRRSSRWFGRGDSGIRHRNQNSTQLGRGSTKGAHVWKTRLRRTKLPASQLERGDPDSKQNACHFIPPKGKYDLTLG